MMLANSLEELNSLRKHVDSLFLYRISSEPYKDDPRFRDAGELACRDAARIQAIIEEFDLQNRSQLTNGEISDHYFEHLDETVGYLMQLWLTYTRSLLDLMRDERRCGPVRYYERIAKLEEMVAEMESCLRARNETEREMGDHAFEQQQAAVKEYHDDETEPFF